MSDRRADRVVVLGKDLRPEGVTRGVAAPLSMRVARWLLHCAGGTARRGEHAPRHLDERAFGFDGTLDTALRSGGPRRLVDLDELLADDLLAGGVRTLRALGRGLDSSSFTAEVDYADAPYGVHYWVARWSR